MVNKRLNKQGKLICREPGSKDYCIVQYLDGDRKCLEVYNSYPLICYITAVLAEDSYIKHYWFMSKEETHYTDPYTMPIPENEFQDIDKNLI